jgi:hypothetical protein
MWCFRPSQPPKPPSTFEVLLDLERAQSRLERFNALLKLTIADLTAVLKNTRGPGIRTVFLRRITFHQTRITQFEAMIDNIDVVKTALANADSTKRIMEAMVRGNKLLRKLHLDHCDSAIHFEFDFESLEISTSQSISTSNSILNSKNVVEFPTCPNRILSLNIQEEQQYETIV